MRTDTNPDASRAARSHAELGRLHARLGRAAEAEAAYRASLAAAESLEAREGLSGLLLDQGRRDEAIAVLRDGLRARPGWDAGRASLTRLLLGQGRFDEAAAALKPLLRAGASPEADLLAGRVEAHAGRLAAAEKRFRAALAAGPEAAFRLAEVLQRRGRDAEAAEFLRGLPPFDRGEGVRPLLDEFRRAFFALDFEGAAAAGERALDRSRRPEDADAMRWPSLAEEFDLTYAGRAHHERALKALDALIRAGRALPWAFYYRAVYRRSVNARGWRREAPRGMSRDFAALSRWPAARYGWMRLEAAKELIVARDLEGALEAFRAVVASTEPGHWMARCHAGELLVCLGRAEEGLAEFARAEADAPPPSKGDAIAWRGEMLLWLGRWEEALGPLREGRARGAQYAHGWIGAALCGLGRWAEALESLDRAVAVSPWDAESRVWRADCLLALGRAREAAAEARRALEHTQDAQAIFARAALGLALAALGDAVGARRQARALPAEVLREVRRRLGLPRTGGDPARLLRGLFELCRGARRSGYPLRLSLGFVPRP